MSKRVVIIDDAIFMRKALGEIVEELGYEVVGEGFDGTSAISLYFELKPDILLIDIVMPNMNGLDASKEILSKDKNAKIVIVSALGQQGLIIDALKSGVKDFIIKPFDKDKLKKVLLKL